MSPELLAPFSFLVDPSSRLFFGCILSSLLLASVVYSLQKGRFDWRAQLTALLDAQYWFNRSTATDIALLVTNNAIRVLILVPLIGSHIWLTLAVGRYLQSSLGDAPELAFPAAAIALAYTLTFFVVEDGSRFSLHWLMHRVPWLWRLHKVHHSATNLTPLTLFRLHPLESILYFVRGALVFSAVSGTFIWLFGRELNTWHILGVDLLGFLFNMLGSNLRHSHVWMTFGPLERWFISPAQHQIHHSSQHRNANLGTCLTIWDRMIGNHLTAYAIVSTTEPYKTQTMHPYLEFGLQEHAPASVGSHFVARNGLPIKNFVA